MRLNSSRTLPFASAALLAAAGWVGRRQSSRRVQRWHFACSLASLPGALLSERVVNPQATGPPTPHVRRAYLAGAASAGVAAGHTWLAAIDDPTQPDGSGSPYLSLCSAVIDAIVSCRAQTQRAADPRMRAIEQPPGAMFPLSLASFVMSLIFSRRQKRKPGRTMRRFMYVMTLVKLVEALRSFRAAIESTAAFERRQTRFEHWMTREGAT